MQKSSRHSKLTGDFGEHLFLYWLSKVGYEVARVDHTGVDLIAKHPAQAETLGISVKSRSRNPGKEATSLSIRNKDVEGARRVCYSFGWTPYFALVVDGDAILRGYLLPLEHLLNLYPGGAVARGWQMTPKRIAEYAADEGIRHFEFRVASSRGWE